MPSLEKKNECKIINNKKNSRTKTYHKKRLSLLPTRHLRTRWSE